MKIPHKNSIYCNMESSSDSESEQGEYFLKITTSPSWVKSFLKKSEKAGVKAEELKQSRMKEMEKAAERLERMKAKQREYRRRDEVKAKRKEYEEKPEVKEKRKSYYSNPAYKSKKAQADRVKREILRNIFRDHPKIAEKYKTRIQAVNGNTTNQPSENSSTTTAGNAET